MEGTLTQRDTEPGFGFITSHDHGTRRAFLHVTEIRQDEIPDLGDRVQFDLLDTLIGLCAVNVQRLEAELCHSRSTSGLNRTSGLVPKQCEEAAQPRSPYVGYKLKTCRLR